MTLFLVVLLFSLLTGLFLPGVFPWWSFAPVAFVMGVIQPRGGWRTFAGGFLAVALLYLAYAAYLNTLSDGRLTLKVAQIFGLESQVVLMILSALEGGLLGGMSALSGWLLRWSFRKKRRY